MTKTIIKTVEDLERFEFNGALVEGALVRDAESMLWLAWDSEEGVYCMRPRAEDDGVVVIGGDYHQQPVFSDLSGLPLPLTITTEGE